MKPSWKTAVTVEPGAPTHRVTASALGGRHWQQVLARDATADGQFFYAVTSTGIYCRPSCPSRRPKFRNVAFFPTAAAAEASRSYPQISQMFAD